MSVCKYLSNRQHIWKVSNNNQPGTREIKLYSLAQISLLLLVGSQKAIIILKCTPTTKKKKTNAFHQTESSNSTVMQPQNSLPTCHNNNGNDIQIVSTQSSIHWNATACTITKWKSSVPSFFPHPQICFCLSILSFFSAPAVDAVVFVWARKSKLLRTYVCWFLIQFRKTNKRPAKNPLPPKNISQTWTSFCVFDRTTPTQPNNPRLIGRRGGGIFPSFLDFLPGGHEESQISPSGQFSASRPRKHQQILMIKRNDWNN